MINKITKEMFPNDWDSFTDDYIDFSSKEHRKYSNFYVNVLVQLDEDNAKEYPQLWGIWESDTVIWDDSNGLEDDVNVLYRVNKVKKTVVTEEWIRVKDETVDSQ